MCGLKVSYPRGGIGKSSDFQKLADHHMQEGNTALLLPFLIQEGPKKRQLDRFLLSPS